MKNVLVDDVIKRLTRSVHLEETVDELLSGSGQTKVTGIFVTFIASHEVIDQAIQKGANLIISHEGSFYSHHRDDGKQRQDPVCKEKSRLINDSGMVIYRFHDHPHRYEPDAITNGLVKKLGWEEFVLEKNKTSTIVSIPEATVQEIANHVKEKLSIPFVRITGDASMTCSRIGLLAGYRGGGQTVIPLMGTKEVEMIIAGEGPEWEAPEYVRDAVYQKRNKALMFIGHSESEEPGMSDVAELLSSAFPAIPVYFAASRPLFQWI